MATSYDPSEHDRDRQSDVPAHVEGPTADFRRDLAFQTLPDDMVRRLRSYGREELLPENVTLYTNGDRDSERCAGAWFKSLRDQ